MSLNINWKKLFNIVIILFSLGLLIYLCVSDNGLIYLIKNSRSINKFYLILSVIFQLLNLIIDAYLIYKFTKSTSNNYTFKKAFTTSMVGQFFSAVTPGATGGQPMQVYSLMKQGIEPGIATSSLIQKFIVYQTTITCYSLFSIFICFDFLKNNISKMMWIFVAIGFFSQAIAIFAILFFSFNRKLTENIIDWIFKFLSKFKFLKISDDKVKNIKGELFYFYKNNQKLFEDKKLLFTTYGCCVLQITCMFIIPYFIYKSFNLSGARLIEMLCSQAFVSMISSFIPLPGASGASEGTFYIFFSLYFTPETIKSAVIVWRFITYYLTILISAPFSRLKSKS